LLATVKVSHSIEYSSGTGYGLLLGAIAAGAFTGPLLLARLPALARRPTAVFAAFGLRGLADLVLASVTALPAALGALVCYGIGTSTGNVIFSTVIQSHVRPTWPVSAPSTTPGAHSWPPPHSPG
jgi:hypothetical protein